MTRNTNPITIAAQKSGKKNSQPSLLLLLLLNHQNTLIPKHIPKQADNYRPRTAARLTNCITGQEQAPEVAARPARQRALSAIHIRPAPRKSARPARGNPRKEQPPSSLSIHGEEKILGALPNPPHPFPESFSQVGRHRE